MSFGNFLKKIWGGIKSIFNDLPHDLKNAVHIGVVVTENVKNFVDSGNADILTAIIPTEVDDVIKTRLRANLPRILTLPTPGIKSAVPISPLWKNKYK